MTRAGGLRGFRALVRKLGGDPDDLLARHQLSAEILDNEDALLPARQTIELLETSARLLRCPDFGLQLAASQDVGTLGPLAFAIQHARTVREAVANASRYLFVQSTAISLTVQIDEARPALAELRYDTPELLHAASLDQAADLVLGLTHRIIAMNLGNYLLHSVALPHAPHAPPATYVRYFGAPVSFEAPCAALRFPAHFLDQAVPDFNETMRALALQYLENHFPDPAQALSSRVRLALSRSLGTPQADIGGIAAMLAMHPRSLQRQLAGERTSFAAIRDEVRREAALRYLGCTGISLAQIAALLGLSEQSALTRCCRRWFGKTPAAIRREGIQARKPPA